MQISARENLDKYFQNAGTADAKKEKKQLTTEVKTSEEQINTDNLKQIKITKIELDMDDLPETFGSSNIANFKKQQLPQPQKLLELEINLHKPQQLQKL